MNLVFTKGKKTFEISMFDSAEVKLYAVPTDYSNDGSYISAWRTSELEPAPACDQSDVALLAHVVATQQENGSFSLQEIFCAKGVTYAQN